MEMQQVTNYGWSKDHRRSAIFFKDDLRTDNGGRKTYTEKGATMKLGDNLDISLLDEYSVYFTRSTEGDGAPIFVVKDGMLYHACDWSKINKLNLKDILFLKIGKKELTAFDALTMLLV